MDALITVGIVGFLIYCVGRAVWLQVAPPTEYTSNCRYCGKRKKGKPGFVLFGTQARYTTCRSCGAEDC